MDIHGVLDANPARFVKLMMEARKEGAIVHILTGIEWSPSVEAELMGYAKDHGDGKPYWDHFGSVISILKKNKVAGFIDERGRYWCDDNDSWDRVKGAYCLEHKATEIYDDTVQYRKYMPEFTEFFLYSFNPVAHEMKLRNPNLFPKPQPKDHVFQENNKNKPLSRS